MSTFPHICAGPACAICRWVKEHAWYEPWQRSVKLQRKLREELNLREPDQLSHTEATE